LKACKCSNLAFPITLCSAANAPMALAPHRYELEALKTLPAGCKKPHGKQKDLLPPYDREKEPQGKVSLFTTSHGTIPSHVLKRSVAKPMKPHGTKYMHLSL